MQRIHGRCVQIHIYPVFVKGHVRRIHSLYENLVHDRAPLGYEDLDMAVPARGQIQIKVFLPPRASVYIQYAAYLKAGKNRRLIKSMHP